MRQLQNFVERLVVLAEDVVIGRADVERELGRGAGRSGGALGTPALAVPAAGSNGATADGDLSLDAQRKEMEREALLRALQQTGNNRTHAARVLEVSRRTLYNKLREHGID